MIIMELSMSNRAVFSKVGESATRLSRQCSWIRTQHVVVSLPVYSIVVSR